MGDFISISIIILSVLRLTHFILYDKLGEFIRLPFLELVEIDGQIFSQPPAREKGIIRHLIGYLFTCHWCMSMWMAETAILGLMYIPGFYYFCLALAISQIVSVLEGLILKNDI